ncbi:MAG TPA: thioredoxin domain-containing protein [Solirubrobacteraceae bacterium]|nr:thioredoxin domain-containing protein [Solirubrobacteraceae bacterium]
MASRAEQKAAARAAREARQRETSAAQARRMRLIWLAGLVAAAALAIVIIVIAVGGGNGTKTVNAKTAQAKVAALLKGIPQSSNVQNGIELGAASAPVTVTEYGDLVCPVCQSFAVGAEEQLIANEVRQGKVKLVYRAEETASQTANNGEYSAGQVAARAAGLQKLGWNYILLWYEQQQSEDTPYVTASFLAGLARQIPRLNYSAWNTQLQNPNLSGYVTTDGQQMNQLLANHVISQLATPTILISGPKGSLPAIQGPPSYSSLQANIKGVS